MPNGRGKPITISQPLLVVLLVVVAVAVVVLLMSVFQAGGTAGPTAKRPVAGTVLAVQTSALTTAAADYDHDGQRDARDPDDDNDGWADPDDPSKSGFWNGRTWFTNLDNDAIAGPEDPNEDNDRVVDARDRFPLDQNNNGSPDSIERRVEGPRFDGDRDGRPDLTELRAVALAEARKLGIPILVNVRKLTDIPLEVFAELPHGWHYVSQDRNNNGKPDLVDPFFGYSRGGSYTSYTDDGAWERDYAKIAAHRNNYGFISPDVNFGSGGVHEPPRYEAPAAWPPPGSTPENSGFAGGTDPYANFYSHIPPAEYHNYQPPPHSSDRAEGAPSSSSGYQSYSPPPGGYSPPPGGYTPPPQHSEGSTGGVPPPPPSYESAPPPPPPSDGGGYHH